MNLVETTQANDYQVKLFSPPPLCQHLLPLNRIRSFSERHTPTSVRGGSTSRKAVYVSESLEGWNVSHTHRSAGLGHKHMQVHTCSACFHPYFEPQILHSVKSPGTREAIPSSSSCTVHLRASRTVTSNPGAYPSCSELRPGYTQVSSCSQGWRGETNKHPRSFSHLRTRMIQNRTKKVQKA